MCSWKAVCGAVMVLLMGSLASTVGAQSLAEIGRREEARRKALETPSKVYTNADLRGGGTLTTSSGLPSQGADTPAQAADMPGQGALGGLPNSADPTEPDVPAAADDAAEPQRDEEYWRGRITSARQQLSRNELFRDALQNRIDGLWAEFTATDDPFQRQEVESKRLDALAEMERIDEEIEAQQEAIADIQEEARRAGVPPGWLR
ncbi:MAG: hypothetical protein QF463_08620 [Vicinamibacterales bacterium]|jgi:hypothetical protein|nr:hypothetical protein [Acidobacteriota bacterium]MDP6373593.1 hypothetical protein [Vicinamibacterales bacterium]MDP6609115.1 hypothetical protein [Vicinamibacterales bacterium]HAK54460.1 hypothetical protein [Acidobacteriota bacterium]|tara:strand:- start:9901 stop:10515 length:615 start_codon:yes stop_codon:yes gene_type:complete